jgi:hydrogenase maturation protease
MAVAIVGAGNILMRDEGIGVKVIEELRGRAPAEGIELFDAGTSIMDLIPELASFGRVIIVDAVRGGNPAGTIYRFRPEDIEGRVQDGGAMSLHQVSLLDALAMERLVSGRTLSVTIIGVEPEAIEMGLELSPALAGKVSSIADLVLKEAMEGTPT